MYIYYTQNVSIVSMLLLYKIKRNVERKMQRCTKNIFRQREQNSLSLSLLFRNATRIPLNTISRAIINHNFLIIT